MILSNYYQETVKGVETRTCIGTIPPLFFLPACRERRGGRVGSGSSLRQQGSKSPKFHSLIEKYFAYARKRR
jgi:hypothetical protein